MKPLIALVVVGSLIWTAGAEPATQAQKKGASVAAVRQEKKAGQAKTEKPAIDTTGRSIMRLGDDVEVSGRPCKRGWLKLHPNGVPSSFTASRELEFGKLKVPADTWVMQDDTGLVLVCALPRDMEIQGVPCRGTGGAKGVQLEVYPCGSLKKVFLSKDTVIQGVPCAAGLLSGLVEFHPDGRLKSCKLSEAYTHAGVAYKKGARLELPAVNGETIASK